MSPARTTTAPEACLANLPVSNEISLPSISTETRVTASDIFNSLLLSALRSAELLRFSLLIPNAFDASGSSGVEAAGFGVQRAPPAALSENGPAGPIKRTPQSGCATVTGPSGPVSPRRPLLQETLMSVTAPAPNVEPQHAGNRWLVLVIACMAQFMVVLDATVVNVALPSIQHGLRLLRRQPAVGRQRLHADLRRLPAARRTRGRPRRPQTAVRRGRLLFSAASLLNGDRPVVGHARRGARSAGPRRRARLARRTGDHHDHLHRAGRAHQGAGRLERDRRRRRRLRAADGRRADRYRLVAVGVLRQRAGRDHHDRTRAALRRRVARAHRAALV